MKMKLEIVAAALVLTAAAMGFPSERERLVAIGFDDFRASDFALVAPLFEKYGARATFNRATSRLHSPCRNWLKGIANER